jgi:multiple sugar transport system substrate-binding protein
MEKYPNVTVMYSKMADSSAQTGNLALASGQPIDVMQQSAIDATRLRASNGMYEPLDKYLQEDAVDFGKTFGTAVKDLSLIDGKIYDIPYANTGVALFYNKNMFDAAGVSYPTDDWTWDDFREAARKLSRGEGANRVYGYVPTYAGSMADWYYLAAEQLGMNYLYKSGGKSSNFDDPAFLKSIQLWYDMSIVDKSMPNYSTWKSLSIDKNTVHQFYQKKAAMIIHGAFFVKYSTTIYGFQGDFEFAVAPFPKLNKGDPAKTIFYTSSNSIPVSSKFKDEAWDWIRYYCIDRPDIFASTKAMMPPVDMTTYPADMQRSVENSIFNFPHFDVASGVKVFITSKPIAIPQYTTITTAKNQINDLVITEIANCMMGNITPAQCVANLKKGADELIKQGSPF